MGALVAYGYRAPDFIAKFVQAKRYVASVYVHVHRHGHVLEDYQLGWTCRRGLAVYCRSALQAITILFLSLSVGLLIHTHTKFNIEEALVFLQILWIKFDQ